MVRLNPFTGQFDIVGGGDADLAALQAQVNALETRVDDLEVEVEQVQKVSVIFDTTDFVLDVDQYVLTVLAADHNKTEPTVFVFEENGADFDEVSASIKVLANSDIQLIVPQSPDLRFNGKLIIT